jgi:hypothetical protein
MTVVDVNRLKRDVKKARDKKFKEFSNQYPKDKYSKPQHKLMFKHYLDGRDDLVETVGEGLYNRAIRRRAAKPQKVRKSRLTKVELLQQMWMVRNLEKSNEHLKKLKENK